MHNNTTKKVISGISLIALSLSSLAFCQVSRADGQQASAINTASPASIQSQEDLVQWMTYYYLHPQPDMLVQALLFADSTGLVDKGQAPLTAFVSRVFVQNPQRISEWVKQLDGLSTRSKPMLWSALWWSSTLEGKQALETLLKTLDEKQSTLVLSQMSQPATPIEQIEIRSPEVLDELWGAFSATGDPKYVDRLISVLPWTYNASGDFTKMTIGSAARWSLTSNAQQHPLVLKACLKARETQPELKGILDRIIADAAKEAGTKTGQSGSSL